MPGEGPFENEWTYAVFYWERADCKRTCLLGYWGWNRIRKCNLAQRLREFIGICKQLGEICAAGTSPPSSELCPQVVVLHGRTGWTLHCLSSDFHRYMYIGCLSWAHWQKGISHFRERFLSFWDVCASSCSSERPLQLTYIWYLNCRWLVKHSEEYVCLIIPYQVLIDTVILVHLPLHKF